MQINDLIVESQKILKEKKLEPNVSFKILFYIFNDINNLNDFVTFKNRKVSLYKKIKFFHFLKQYINGKPIQYITHESFFYDLNFHLLKRVHSPRVETELLVDKANKLICKNNYQNVLDLCCGSGCIGLSIANSNNITLTCSDIWKKAIKNTLINSKLLNINANIIKSDLFKKINGKFDLIICNPPYISNEEKIDNSVLKYESKLALFANDNGLSFYYKILKDVKNYLNEGGSLIMEFGYKQKDKIEEILLINKLIKKVEFFKDEIGHFRCVIVYF